MRTPIVPRAVPAELRALAQWVVWRTQVRQGKPTKVPYRADDPTAEASSTDPATWATFAKAGAAAKADPRLDGIGFVFAAGGGLAGVDLDNCLDDAGQPRPWAGPILDRLASYAEVSPSGRGVKVFLRGSVPGGKGRKKQKLGDDGKGAIEVYDRGRYFTVTGRRLARSPAELVDCAAELAALHADWFPPKPKGTAARPKAAPLDLSDRAILDRMFRAKNGPELEALFHGQHRHASGSEADLALCSHLAFWAGGDIDAIDRLFRQSALFDEKWATRADYRERTITRALEGQAFYDPHHGRNGNGNGHAALNGNGHAGGPPDGNGVLNGHAAPAPGPNEAPNDPHRLARLFLERRYRHGDFRRLVFWDESWHRWDGSAWRPMLPTEVSAELTNAIKNEFDGLATAAGKPAQPVTTKVVGNAMQALRGVALLPGHECPGQPSWLGLEPGEDLPDPVEVLPTTNALVHLPSFAEGNGWRIAPTPRFFSPMSLGYGFAADAPPPAEWLRFLGQLWPDDPESIAALQEWFGYLLTPDTRQQKILMLIGPKRSGKGTVGRVLRALVGPANVAAPTLSGLSTPFGLQPLIGKTVALIADARLSGRADGQQIVERLLSVSGEDAQTVDRKHLPSWTGNLSARFVLISNELPRLGDSSGALPGRMILLRLTRSFYGQEDDSLTGRLLAERPAILRWAITGWVRLRERGRFVQPESGRELMADMEELASPIKAFVADRCEVGPDCQAGVKELYEAWKSWCKDKGKDHAGDIQGFGRSLRAALPHLKAEQPRRDGDRVRVYRGVDLKPEDIPSSKPPY